MRYKLIRIKAGQVKSSNPLRDEEIEFESETQPIPTQLEPFIIVTTPRVPEACARIITTSPVMSVYTIDEEKGIIGFNTETGSSYYIEKVNE